jgi:hypothetical protein
MASIKDIYSTPLDESFTRFSVLWEALLDEWEKLSVEVPEAKHAYDVRFEAEYLKASGTIPDKKAEATQRTKDEYLANLRSEARLEFVKAKIKWIDKEMSILQTKAATMRSEMQMSSLPNLR